MVSDDHFLRSECRREVKGEHAINQQIRNSSLFRHDVIHVVDLVVGIRDHPSQERVVAHTHEQHRVVQRHRLAESDDILPIEQLRRVAEDEIGGVNHQIILVHHRRIILDGQSIASASTGISHRPLQLVFALRALEIGILGMKVRQHAMLTLKDLPFAHTALIQASKHRGSETLRKIPVGTRVGDRRHLHVTHRGIFLRTVRESGTRPIIAISRRQKTIHGVNGSLNVRPICRVQGGLPLHKPILIVAHPQLDGVVAYVNICDLCL